jgi:hypothetical protein
MQTDNAAALRYFTAMQNRNTATLAYLAAPHLCNAVMLPGLAAPDGYRLPSLGHRSRPLVGSQQNGGSTRRHFETAQQCRLTLLRCLKAG